ncbi:MAG: amidase [Verrucomicrobiota bacterium]|nr:amidase [Verrucomicrobiota bacterium]
MRIVDYPLSKGQWYPEKQQKKFIVWHGTRGRTAYTPSDGRPGVATSSIDGWNDDESHVGTPFLVDRDGTIYRTFQDEREWILHLGLADTKGRYDKASIGIEFANELELIAANRKFYAFDRIHHNSEYVGPRLQRTWRVHDWWAQLDIAQVDAAIELTVDLCRRHGIPKTFFYPSTTYDFPHCFEVAGVLCHSNCRQDKTDLLLEDWVWTKLKAAGFEFVGEAFLLPAELAIAAATKVVSVAAALTRRRKGSRRPPPLGKAKVLSPDGSLNVRSAPSFTARKLRTLKNGKVVKVFGLQGDWACITASGKSWVARRYLEPVESAKPVEVTLTLLAPTVDHQVT